MSLQFVEHASPWTRNNHSSVSRDKRQCHKRDKSCNSNRVQSDNPEFGVWIGGFDLNPRRLWRWGDPSLTTKPPGSKPPTRGKLIEGWVKIKPPGDAGFSSWFQIYQGPPRFGVTCKPVFPLGSSRFASQSTSGFAHSQQKHNTHLWGVSFF